MQQQSGRSILEIIAILALMALITLGGIHIFSLLHANSIANALEDALASRVAERKHLLMANPNGGSQKLDDIGPYNTPFTIENGSEAGSLEGVFWIDVGTIASPINLKICQRLINSSVFNPIKITLNNNDEIVTADDCQEENVVRFYFLKKAGDTVPNITIQPDGCPERICPTGAFCQNNTWTCVPGYYRSGDLCSGHCPQCTGRTISSSNDAESCTECPYGQQPNENHTTCENCPKRTSGCCEPPLLSNGNGDCYECLNSSDCQPGKYCSGDHTCENAEAGDDMACLSNDHGNIGKDAIYADGEGGCVACLNDYNAETHQVGDCLIEKPICASDRTQCLPCESPRQFLDGVCTCPADECNGEELLCNPGRYWDTEDEMCKPCPAGTYSDAKNTATACTPCPIGTYPNNLDSNTDDSDDESDDEVGSTACISCPAGTHGYRDDANLPQCKDCAPGTYQNNTGATSCSDCAAGTYQDLSGQTSCKNCGTPQYSQTGALLCLMCDGTFEYISSDHSACLTCQPGFKANSTHTGCVPCNKTERCNCECPTPYSSGTSEGGCRIVDHITETSCPNCESGYCFKDGECEPLQPGTSCSGVCNPGYYKSNGECVKCPKGSYCINEIRYACPKGTSNPKEGQSNKNACVDCPVGTYNNLLGQAACTDCPAGTYNKKTRQTSCTQCGKGTYSPNARSTSCTKCPIGEYQASKGQSSCNKCTDWRANTTTTSTGSQARKSCVCDVGYFLKSKKCTLCPDGSTKSKASNSTSCSCTNKKYKWATKSSKCYRTITENYTCDNKHGSHIGYDWLKARYNCYSYGTTSVSKCDDSSSPHTHYWCMAHDTCTKSITKYYPN